MDNSSKVALTMFICFFLTWLFIYINNRVKINRNKHKLLQINYYLLEHQYNVKVLVGKCPHGGIGQVYWFEGEWFPKIEQVDYFIKGWTFEAHGRANRMHYSEDPTPKPE
jgi:hypothetical protein